MKLQARRSVKELGLETRSNIVPEDLTRQPILQISDCTVAPCPASNSGAL